MNCTAPEFDLAERLFQDEIGDDTSNRAGSDPFRQLSERVKETTVETYHPLIPEIADVGNAIEREILCKAVAKKIGVSVSMVRKAVNGPNRGEAQSESIVEDIEPWDTPVDGLELLQLIHNILESHVVMELHCTVACALWISVTYAYDSFRIFPILAITSPEKRCGKTTLLELLAGLTYKPLLASNITPSAIFRTIEKCQPCLLIDEADTFLKDNEELRGIVNSGHTRRSAFVIRTNPTTLEVEKFSTWGPKAIALIGRLPETIADRSIPIRLERKTTCESVQRVGIDFDGEQRNFRRRMKRWGDDSAKLLKAVSPEIPDTGNDRAQDNWSPLLAIAELAGGNWPERARAAMLNLEKASDTESIKQILLKDIRTIFGVQDRISSKELVQGLVAIEDHPWSDWKKGKQLSQNGLANLLRPYAIQSKTIRIGESTPKGYMREQFADVFERYLPTPQSQNATTTQPAPSEAFREFQSATQPNDVADENYLELLPVKECGTVAVKNTIPEEHDYVTV